MKWADKDKSRTIWGYIRVMLGLNKGYIGRIENTMETIILGLLFDFLNFPIKITKSMEL